MTIKTLHHEDLSMNMKRLFSLLALVGSMSSALPYKGFNEADTALRLLQIATIDGTDYETLKTVTGMVMANKALRAGGQAFNSIRGGYRGGFYDDTQDHSLQAPIATLSASSRTVQRPQPKTQSYWSGLNVVSSLADTASLGHDWAYYKRIKDMTAYNETHKVDIKKKALWAGLALASYILSSKTVENKLNGTDTAQPGSLGSTFKNYLAPILAIAQRYMVWKEQHDRVEQLNNPVEKCDTDALITLDESAEAESTEEVMTENA